MALMEGISVLFYSIWEQLKTQTVPILEINFADFLIGLFAIKIGIDILRFFLGLQLGSTSSVEYDTGLKSSYVNGTWKRSRETYKRNGGNYDFNHRSK